MSSGKIDQLAKLFFKEGGFPQDVRIFVPTTSHYFYVNNGHAQLHRSVFGLMTNLKTERGEVLDAFAKVEFVTVEMLRFAIVGFEPTDAVMEVVKTLSVVQRINILEELKYLEEPLAKRLKFFFTIRNQLAHKFDSSEVTYNGKHLFEQDNFQKFQAELQSIWNELISEYDKMLEKFDLVVLIKKIEEYQTKLQK